jgi:hypothetical protein
VDPKAGQDFWRRVNVGAARQIPNSDPEFHYPLIVDGSGRSARASFVILIKECLFRVGLFISLCVVVPLIR